MDEPETPVIVVIAPRKEAEPGAEAAAEA